MSLELIPHLFAILFSVGAFAVAWLTGLAGEVPLHAIALRATVGAALFWVVGLVVGKVFVNCVYTAVSEHMAERQVSSARPDGNPVNAGRRSRN